MAQIDVNHYDEWLMEENGFEIEYDPQGFHTWTYHPEFDEHLPGSGPLTDLDQMKCPRKVNRYKKSIKGHDSEPGEVQELNWMMVLIFLMVVATLCYGVMVI